MFSRNTKLVSYYFSTLPTATALSNICNIKNCLSPFQVTTRTTGRKSRPISNTICIIGLWAHPYHAYERSLYRYWYPNFAFYLKGCYSNSYVTGKNRMPIIVVNPSPHG